jgi:hypothetical protein
VRVKLQAVVVVFRAVVLLPLAGAVTVDVENEEKSHSV